MAINLPYRLREGQKAYAAKVMANFEALLAAYNNIHIEGLGEGDFAALLGLLYQAAVMAGKDGNANEIVFSDGESLTQKFDAGTLNASLLNSNGLFYSEVDPSDGHLYLTASECIDENAFSIDQNGHLIFSLEEPENNEVIHRYDLGNVRGETGPAGAGGMSAAIYDPNNLQKDPNIYSGVYICFSGDWVDNEIVLSDSKRVTGDYLSSFITANSGHAFIGLAVGASDAAAQAWMDAAIVAVSQGAGQITLRALGDVPDVTLLLQVYMFK